MNQALINKEFRIVFRPKEPLPGKKYRKFLVGAGQLAKYVTLKNAEIAFERALNSLTDRTTIKLRKFGTIDFYVK